MQDTAHHRNTAARPNRLFPCETWGILPTRPAHADVVLCWLSDASPANANAGWVSAGARHSSSGVVSGATAEQSAVALVISRGEVFPRTISPRAGADDVRPASLSSPVDHRTTRLRVRVRSFRNRCLSRCADATMPEATFVDVPPVCGATCARRAAQDALRRPRAIPSIRLPRQGFPRCEP